MREDSSKHCQTKKEITLYKFWQSNLKADFIQVNVLKKSSIEMISLFYTVKLIVLVIDTDLMNQFGHLYFFDDFSLLIYLKSLAKEILSPCLSCLSKRYSWRVFRAIVDCRTFSKSTKQSRYYRPLIVVFLIKRMH